MAFSPAVKPSAVKLSAEKSSADRSSADRSSADRSSADQSSADKSPVDKSSANRSPVDKPSPVPPRSTYRHGDLRRALLEAGVELARAGGPDAVVLREATRRAGVVPNAAYRHFAGREDLLEAVRATSLSMLAVAMEKELGRLRRGPDAAEFARSSLRAVGAGYLKFALAQTGLFRTAFSVPAAPEDRDPAKVGGSGLNPFQLLSASLDLMVEAGALPLQRRQGAEFLAWSAVHGFAVLLIEGPLKGIAAKQTAALGQRLLNMVEKGL